MEISHDKRQQAEPRLCASFTSALKATCSRLSCSFNTSYRPDVCADSCALLQQIRSSFEHETGVQGHTCDNTHMTTHSLMQAQARVYDARRVLGGALGMGGGKQLKVHETAEPDDSTGHRDAQEMRHGERKMGRSSPLGSASRELDD